jgi:hypothetical protein
MLKRDMFPYLTTLDKVGLIFNPCMFGGSLMDVDFPGLGALERKYGVRGDFAFATTSEDIKFSWQLETGQVLKFRREHVDSSLVEQPK